MRIAVLALSTVLLSGCSWLGLDNQQTRYSGTAFGTPAGNYYGQAPNSQQYSQARRQNTQRQGGRCEITSVSHPIPQGCSPEQVTISLPQSSYEVQSSGNYEHNFATAQGYDQVSQTPNTKAYGKSVEDARRNAGLLSNVAHKEWSRPRLRVTGSLGLERSVLGDLIDKGAFASTYNVRAHAESITTGSQAEGQIVNTTYYVANPDSAADHLNGINGIITSDANDISVSDVYGAPTTASFGAEYHFSDNISVFGNLSHTVAQGDQIGGGGVVGDITRLTNTTNYEEITDPLTGDVTGYTSLGTTSSNSQFLNVVAAKNTLEVSDMKRNGVEIGGRFYFNDAFANHLERPVAPYVSASIGGAHYNALTAEQSLQELYLSDYYNSATVTGGDANYYLNRTTPLSTVEVLKEGWVGTGSVLVGAEWQVTPKTALALETGVRLEGGREISAGGKTNKNTIVPLTLRGSIGF